MKDSNKMLYMFCLILFIISVYSIITKQISFVFQIVLSTNLTLELNRNKMNMLSLSDIFLMAKVSAISIIE